MIREEQVQRELQGLCRACNGRCDTQALESEIESLRSEVERLTEAVQIGNSARTSILAARHTRAPEAECALLRDALDELHRMVEVAFPRVTQEMKEGLADLEARHRK